MTIRRKILLIAGGAVLAVGLGVGVALVLRQQLFEKKAAVPEGTAQVRIQPPAKTAGVGERFPAQIVLTPGPAAISAVTVQLDWDYTGTDSPLTVTDIQLNSALLGTGEWSVPIKTYTAQGGHARVRIAAVNTSIRGYENSGEVTLATLTFLARGPGTITVTFDATESKVTSKATGQDTLLIPTSRGVYTVSGGEAATPTPTVPPGVTPTPTLPPGVTPSPTLVPSPTNVPVGGNGTTPTPTLAPTAVPTTAAPTPTPDLSGLTPTPSVGGDLQELPQTGVFETTLLLGAVGLILMGAGLVVLGKR